MDNNNLNQNLTPDVEAGAQIVTKAKHTGLFVGIGCGVGAFAVAGVVTACALNGAFLSKPKKVVAAGAKTFENMMVVDDMMSFAELASNKQYTLEMGAEYQGIEGSISYIVDGKDKALSANVKGEIENFNLDVSADALIDDKAVSFMAPILGNTVYYYNYTKVPTGEIFSGVDEETLKTFNGLIKYVYELEPSQKDAKKELLQAVMDEVDNMEFESVDAETFEINEKEKKCKGYETKITGKNLANIVDNIYDEFAADYKKEMEKLAEAVGSPSEVQQSLEKMDKSFEDLKDDLREMEPIRATFYLDGMNYAAIVLKKDDSKLEILFQGGERATQNMKIKADGETVLQIKGSTDDGIEKSEWIVDGETVLKLRHDKSDNVTKVSLGENISFKYSLTTNRNKGKLKIYDLESGNSKLDGFVFYMSIEKGAKMPSMKGDKLDLGEASTAELMSAFEKAKEAIENTFGGSNGLQDLEDLDLDDLGGLLGSGDIF